MPNLNGITTQTKILEKLKFPTTAWKLKIWASVKGNEHGDFRYVDGEDHDLFSNNAGSLLTLDEALELSGYHSDFVAMADGEKFTRDKGLMNDRYRRIDSNSLETPDVDPFIDLPAIKKMFNGAEELIEQMNALETKDQFQVLLDSHFQFLKKLRTHCYRDNQNAILGIVRDASLIFEKILNKSGVSMFSDVRDMVEDTSEARWFREFMVGLGKGPGTSDTAMKAQAVMYEIFASFHQEVQAEMKLKSAGGLISDAFEDCPYLDIASGLRFPDARYRSANGEIWMGTRRLCARPLFVCRQMQDLNGVEPIRYEIAFKDPRNIWRKTTMIANDYMDPKKMHNLVALGMPATPKTARDTSEYIGEFIDANGTRIPTEVFYANMGWTTDKKDAFIWGNHIITADGIAPMNVQQDGETAEIVKCFEQSGTMEEWFSNVFVPAAGENLGNFRFLFPLGHALASVYNVVINRPSGAIVNLYGDSSGGKSTLNKAVLSAVCRPVKGVTFMGWESNPVGIETRCGFNGDVPLFLDDSTGITKPKNIQAIIYTIANGVGKNRGSISKSGLGRSKKWNLNTISSSEYPLKMYSETSGSNARVFDIGLKKGEVFVKDAQTADEINANTQSYYGVLFPDFVQKIILRIKEDGGKKDITDIRALQNGLISATNKDDEVRDPGILARNAEAGAIATFALGMTFRVLTDHGLVTPEKAREVAEKFQNDMVTFLRDTVKPGQDQKTKTLDWLRSTSVLNSHYFWKPRSYFAKLKPTDADDEYGYNDQRLPSKSWWGRVDIENDQTVYYWTVDALTREVKNVVEKGITYGGVISIAEENGILFPNPKRKGGQWPKDIKGGTINMLKFIFPVLVNLD